MKILKKYTLAVLGLALLGKAFAQPASPLSEGTDGLFSTDTDNVVSLTGYNNVVFDDFLVTGTYGYVGASSSNTAHLELKTHVINGGGMFKVGNITFGVSYLGAFAGNSSEEVKISNTEHNGQDAYTEKENTIPMLHNIKLLVGVPITDEINLGVRTGVDIGGKISSVSGNGLSLSDLQTFKNENSLSFKPQLAAGTKLALGNGWTLSPTIDMFVSITNSSGAGQSVYPGEDTGPATAQDGSVYEKRNVMKTYLPGATLGVGIGFPTESNVNMSANISYGFDVRVQPEKFQYSKSYNSTDQQSAEGTHTMRSDSGHSHSLVLKFGANTSMTEKLKLAGRVQLDAAYKHVVDGGTTSLKTTGNVVFETKKTIESDTVFVQPVISAGATYQITETLSWYGGMKLVHVAYTFQKESQYSESDVVIDDGQDLTIHTIRYPILASFGTGLQFQPVEELLVSAGLLFAPSDPKEELSTIGNVLSNANLRLSLVWKDIPNK